MLLVHVTAQHCDHFVMVITKLCSTSMEAGTADMAGHMCDVDEPFDMHGMCVLLLFKLASRLLLVVVVVL